MSYQCRYAYEKPGGRMLMCRAMSQNPYCLHMYYCPMTKRLEVTDGGRSCAVKERYENKGEK